MDNLPAASPLPEPNRSLGSQAVIISTSRLEHLIHTGQAQPRFLQGVFPFAGRSMFSAIPLDDSLSYIVPFGKSAEIVYFRAGNLSDDLLYLALTANDKPIRYFPIGPKADIHVPLAIIDPHPAGTHIHVGFAAPHGLTGTVILDVGILEIDEEAVGNG